MELHYYSDNALQTSTVQFFCEFENHYVITSGEVQSQAARESCIHGPCQPVSAGAVGRRRQQGADTQRRQRREPRGSCLSNETDGGGHERVR